MVAKRTDLTRFFEITGLVLVVAELVLGAIGLIGARIAANAWWGYLIFAGALFFGFLCFLIIHRNRSNDPFNAERWGRAGLIVFLVSYVALVGVLAWFDPVDLPTWLWVVSGLFGIMIPLQTAVLLRLHVTGSERTATWSQIAFMVCVFLTGAGLLGISGATVGIALVAFRQGSPFTGECLLFEAATIATAGVTLLVARRMVVSLALFFLGLVVISFGAASLADADYLFGASLLVAGVTAGTVALFVARRSNVGLALGFGIAALSATFVVVASIRQAVPAFGIPFGLMAVVLGAMAVLTLWTGDISGLFRFPNEYRPWTRYRYYTVICIASLAALFVGLWTVSTIIQGRLGGTVAIGGCFIACVAATITLIVAYRRSKHRASRSSA